MESSSGSVNSTNIRVVTRVRPLNSSEKANNSEFIVKFPSHNTIELANRMFTYDHVLGPSTQQSEVYAVAAKPLVKDVLSGYNATIFAYGQTSSGKTHTMEGELNVPDLRGIIPRIIDDIFEHIYGMDANLEIHIKVSYFEIYMEKIRDLLDVTKQNLPIGETKNKIPYVKGITERFVTSPEEILAVLDEGKANRQVAVTDMNAHSSRSHAVFLIRIKQENKDTRQTITGKLYLVDLAGSERVDKTNAVGLTLKQAMTINTSLLSLSKVISALAEGQPFAPYRDSKLTRVLQESLGGNARTTLIICCSPSSYNKDETKSTLMFGDRAKTIKNKVAINLELPAEEWRRRYEKQREANHRLKAKVESYERELRRWMSGETIPEEEQVLNTRSHVSTADESTTSIPAHLTPITSHSDVARMHATPTPETPRSFEEEKAKLCQQIDEKDEEIQSQGEVIEKLTMQITDLEESLQTSQKESISLREQLSIFEGELSNSQEEVREVMTALEELAVSYDSKDREIESISTEKQLLLEEMESLQTSMEQKTQELNSVKDLKSTEVRKNNERFSTLFSDLKEIGSVLGAKGELHLESTTDLSDDDFARVRIHLSNLRCEARTLAEQRDILEDAEREAKERANVVLKELSTCRLKISQFETQNESLSAHLRESEQKKKDLEGMLLTLNQQLLSLKTKEQVLMASELDREQEQAGLVHSANEMKRTFEEELQKHKESHLQQVAQLQAEITTKETLISNMTQQYQTQLLEIEGLRADLSQSVASQREEETKYSKIRLQMKVKERLKQDLGGLTDTVSRELERLNGLRQSYILRMTQRLKSSGDGSEEGITPDRREIQFLERNLEELTRAHKKTASENSDLQREIPRLHTILATKSRRIGELETLLQDTKAAASKEYERLRQDNERIKTNFMRKLKEKEKEAQYGRIVRRQGPNIVRPVPRKSSDSSSSREALLAGAGVAVIGQRRKPRQLHVDDDSNVPASSTSDPILTTPSSSSKYGLVVIATMGLLCLLLYETIVY